MKRKVIVFFLICSVFMSFCSFVNAAADNPIDAMKDLKDGGTVNESATGKLKPIMNTIIGFIQIVGTGVSVIMVSVLGIKYMMAAPGEKADIKKQITPMVIGAFLLFAAVNIINAVAEFSAELPTG